MKTPSIVDVLIENITTDQTLLKEADAKINDAKQEKVAVVDRLKDYRKEITVIAKYATDEQKEKIEALGFDTTDNATALNTVASLAFDVIVKAKDNKLTNKEWYEAYLAQVKNKDEAVNYTAFNIRCRTLFNSQRIIRLKSGDVSSHDDIISLNGTSIKKIDLNDGVNQVKKTSDTPSDVKDSQKKEVPNTIPLKKVTVVKDKKDDTTSKQK